MAKPNTDPSQVDQATILENLKIANQELETLRQENSIFRRDATQYKETIAQDADKISALQKEVAELRSSANQLSDNQAKQVEQLIAEKKELAEELASVRKETEAFRQQAADTSETEKFRQQADDNFRAANKASLRADELEKENELLKEQLATAEGRETGIILSPLAKSLLKALAESLSEKYSTKIKPQQILEDYLIRYNIQRFAVWFHPFVLSDSEIEEIIQKHFPDVTLRSYKYMLGNRKKGEQPDED